MKLSYQKKLSTKEKNAGFYYLKEIIRKEEKKRKDFFCKRCEEGRPLHSLIHFLL